MFFIPNKTLKYLMIQRRDTLGYVVKRDLTDDLVYVSYDTTYITWFNGYEVPTKNEVSYSNRYGEIGNMIAPTNQMV